MDYSYVQSWHYKSGSMPYYVDNLVARAKREKAPADATYRAMTEHGRGLRNARTAMRSSAATLGLRGAGSHQRWRQKRLVIEPIFTPEEAESVLAALEDSLFAIAGVIRCEIGAVANHFLADCGKVSKTLPPMRSFDDVPRIEVPHRG